MSLRARIREQARAIFNEYVGSADGGSSESTAYFWLPETSETLSWARRSGHGEKDIVTPIRRLARERFIAGNRFRREGRLTAAARTRFDTISERDRQTAPFLSDAN